MQTKSICTIKDLEALKGDAKAPLIVYGAGDMAERIYRVLEDLGVLVTCFCTTDDQKQEKVLFGKKVISYEALRGGTYHEYRILIATCMFNMQEIMQTLISRQEKNIVYFFENVEIFLMLYQTHAIKVKDLPELTHYRDMTYDQLTSHIENMELTEGKIKQVQYSEIEDQLKPELNYPLMHKMLIDIKNNAKAYQDIHDMMSDNLSKQVLKSIILACLCQSRKPFVDAFCLNGFSGEAGFKNEQYFCDDIFQMSDQEVFVQCGGFDGFTVRMFIWKYKKYRKIYVYEPTPKQFEITEKNLSKFSNVIVKQKGVFDRQDKLKFIVVPGQAGNRVGENGDVEIDVVKLDDDVKEPISFIAMDVEGAEIPALRGAKRHIETALPKLAICVYHTPEALREAVFLIQQFSPKYRFYLRHHTISNVETVLYATAK